MSNKSGFESEARPELYADQLEAGKEEKLTGDHKKVRDAEEKANKEGALEGRETA